MKHFNLHEGDYVYSEISGLPCTDIHHIDNKGMGGSNNKDYIENLIALTREEHELCHKHKSINDYAKIVHEYFLKNNPYNNPEDSVYFNKLFNLNISKIKLLT
jgi:hypothetical protein